MTTIIDLIRHGEPVGGRKYRGQIDDPLSEKGWQQMRDAVGDHRPWQAIVTSPLSRCSEFATELSRRHQLPLHTDARLQEIGFGSWEGKTSAEIKAEDPDKLSRFWQDPIGNRPAGAEPLQDFYDRVSAALQDLLTQHTDQHILIVCHAGVIRMSLLHLLGIPLQHAFRIQVGNASITRFEVEQAQARWFPRLLFHGGQL
ncbi:MAG: alpha-ribazole phosphatase [Gammaproteobacteria bacterium]|nr:alpha-ribazole phosphatase [Gammaproteobacteria bacterium]